MENNIPLKIDTASDYEKMSEINDMKQHANKIIQGIKNLNNDDYDRAIWELFQNAIDLSKECHITVRLTDKTLDFCHNGELFTPMTLDCLFKQVSSKTLEEKKQLYDETDPIGQYGTGFITTHSFGKKITISGGLLKENGYIPFNNFTIDRSTDNWITLAEHIRDLKKEVVSILKSEELRYAQFPETNFSYEIATEQNKVNAAKALDAIKLILPYVMSLNPKLCSVTVIDIDGNNTVYTKGNISVIGDLTVREISINENIQNITYIESEKVTVILPIDKYLSAFDLDKMLPRLFLCYPLISTQYLGINYIVHSRQFQPTEPRTGLHLMSNNDSNLKDEERNRALINEASTIIFNFIKNNIKHIASPVKLATINFPINGENTLLNEYFKKLKTEWVTQFKDYSIVETEIANISPKESFFFDRELLLNDNAFDSIYYLANTFWEHIPKKDLVKVWTEKMEDWGLEEINWIKINDIIEKIDTAKTISTFNKEHLKQFYEYAIEQGHAEIFYKKRLLPNIKGDLRAISGNEGLYNSLNLPAELIEIADVIMPEISKRHVDPDFKFNLEFDDYSRKNYSLEINGCINKQIDERCTSDKVDGAFLHKLIAYCKISTTADSTSVPSRMMKLISQFYKEQDAVIVISSIKEDELDIRSSQKKLLKLFLNDLSNKKPDWVIENLTFIKEVLEVGVNYGAYEEYFQTLAIFPNQLNELEKQGNLFVDGNVLDEIKNLYDSVIVPNLPIRAQLSLPEFSIYLENQQKITTTRNLTEKIEGKFFDNQIQSTISEHPYKKEILDIIEKTKSQISYKEYFPLTYSKRSNILVDLADGEDSFAILSLDSVKIKKLAHYGNNPDFDEIVKLGEEALAKQHQENANFQHKYTIGRHIELILRKELSSIIPENLKAEVQDVQDGQDIIIKIDEEPHYYIEVKSRWDTSSPIRMSKNQTLKANKERENYALCSVDMARYIGDDRYNIANISTIEPFIKFDTEIGVKVSHLTTVLNQTNDPETIHLDGDYRTLIPMKIIDKGCSLAVFVDYIVELLKNKLHF